MLTEPLALQPDHRPDPQVLRRSIEYHLHFTVGKNPAAATLTDWRLAVSRAIRDLVIAPWFETTARIRAGQYKRVCYLSMEFLRSEEHTYELQSLMRISYAD